MDLKVDLAHQTRLGAAFALPKEGGGTGRDDGRGVGIIVTCKSRDLAYTMLPGDVVELESTYSFGTEPGIIRTRRIGGRVFGVVVEGGDYNGTIKVLTGGSTSFVKLGGTVTKGQYLYGDASGAALGSTPLTGGVFGVALASGTSGDLIPAYVECDIVFVGRHGQLADSAGIAGHTDLARGAYITMNGWVDSVHNDLTQDADPIRDGDPTTFITELTTGAITMDFDLGLGRETAVTGLFLRTAYSGGSTTTVTLKGDDDPAFGSATTIYSNASFPVGNSPTIADTEVLFPPSAAFRRYRLSITVSSGQMNLYTVHLWEAVGATIHVTDPVTGDGAILDDVLAGFSSAVDLDDLGDVTLTSPAAADRLRFDGTVWRNSALIWAPVMVLDPGTGNYLVLTTLSGDPIMAEV